MKFKRQEKILQLIGERMIETQEELLGALLECGFKVTQATISRDIKELNIIKVSDGKGGYKYARHENHEILAESAKRFHNVFKEAVKNIDCAQNIVLIKTYMGMGSAVGATVDLMQPDFMLGSIAGDDTVLIVTRTTENAEELCVVLKKLLS